MSSSRVCVASVKVVPMSYYKVNLVAGLIRKISVKDAKVQLSFSKKKAAGFFIKLLDSCVANARNNFNMNVDTLSVKEVLVGRAFILKRFTPRGRGRSSRIEKRYSNIKIILAESLPVVPDVVKKVAKKRASV